MILSNGHIALRAPELKDVDSLYILENDPRTWTDGATFAPLSRKQLWDYISTYDGDIFSAGQLRLVIHPVDKGEMVGVIDLYDYDKTSRRAYIGVLVKEQFRGLGIAGEALELLINYCRDCLDMRQLAAIVRAGNEASERLFIRHGFAITGRFPEWIKSEDGWSDALHLQKNL